jgi:hypothetical protein
MKSRFSILALFDLGLSFSYILFPKLKKANVGGKNTLTRANQGKPAEYD